MSRPRIKNYIKDVFGEEVLADVMSGKRTVSYNGELKDPNATNFSEIRIAESGRIGIGDPINVIDPDDNRTAMLTVVETPLETVVVETPPESPPEPILENPIVETVEAPVETPPIETPVETETTEPEAPAGLRYKRQYRYHKEGLEVPAGAKVFVTPKSGKKYVLKIIGQKNTFVTE